jgi:hypothetical protein
MMVRERVASIADMNTLAVPWSTPETKVKKVQQLINYFWSPPKKVFVDFFEFLKSSKESPRQEELKNGIFMGCMCL